MRDSWRRQVPQALYMYQWALKGTSTCTLSAHSIRHEKGRGAHESLKYSELLAL